MPPPARTAAKADDRAAKTTAKTAGKSKPSRYEDDDEFETEDKLASAFIGRISKGATREPPKVTRTQVQKSGRERIRTYCGTRCSRATLRCPHTVLRDTSMPPDRVIPCAVRWSSKNWLKNWASGLTA